MYIMLGVLLVTPAGTGDVTAAGGVAAGTRTVLTTGDWLAFVDLCTESALIGFVATTEPETALRADVVAVCCLLALDGIA